MEVEFQVSKEDYIDYYKTHLKENFQKRIPIVAVLLFFVIASPNAEHFDLEKTVLFLLGYGLLLSTLFYFLPFLLFNNQLKKLIAADPGYSELRKWTIQEEGLKSEGTSSTSIRNWESLIKAQANKKYISITLVDKRFLMVPKSSFTSDAEATNFLGLIQTKIFKAQGLSNLTFNKSTGFYKKEKPPYAMGLLGFIPLVGAIVGVALILYGIIKYKDKWLIAIGVAGIAFSIFVYGSLFYYGEHGKVFKEGFAEMDKGTLNTLVKEIEFYKIQNGQYPDKLYQLNIKDQFTNLVDPLSSGKSQQFNYHLIGKKYQLFSSGIDEIPNTIDDIYPTLEIDTNKMGLIINDK